MKKRRKKKKWQKRWGCRTPDYIRKRESTGQGGEIKGLNIRKRKYKGKSPAWLPGYEGERNRSGALSDKGNELGEGQKSWKREARELKGPPLVRKRRHFTNKNQFTKKKGRLLKQPRSNFCGIRPDLYIQKKGGGWVLIAGRKLKRVGRGAYT